MKFSPLITSLIKSQWAIDPRLVESNRLLIEKLLTRDFSSFDDKILSEKKPISFAVANCASKSMLSIDDVDSIEAGDFNDLQDESTIIMEIAGTMLKHGTMCSYGTQELAQSLHMAGMHEKVGSLVLLMDSGGGSADSIAPLVESMQVIKNAGKSIVSCVDLSASANYFVASYSDEIVAGNDISAEIGSVGVMCTFRDYAKKLEDEGIKEHVIYSSLSNWKNKPFELALKGEYDEIRKEELDPLALRFQQAIKANRGDKLNEETPGLLAGRMFFAEQAKQVGLIDHVGNLSLAIQRARELRDMHLVKNYYNL
jgi:protease IV